MIQNQITASMEVLRAENSAHHSSGGGLTEPRWGNSQRSTEPLAVPKNPAAAVLSFLGLKRRPFDLFQHHPNSLHFSVNALGIR